MAATYRYEKVTEKLDGTIIVEALTHDPVNNPSEQTLLVLEFPAGTTVAAVNNKVAAYANVVANLNRA